MRKLIAVFALKQAVKYLRKHPDLIPGPVDDWIVNLLAKQLGV